MDESVMWLSSPERVKPMVIEQRKRRKRGHPEGSSQERNRRHHSQSTQSTVVKSKSCVPLSWKPVATSSPLLQKSIGIDLEETCLVTPEDTVSDAMFHVGTKPCSIAHTGFVVPKPRKSATFTKSKASAGVDLVDIDMDVPKKKCELCHLDVHSDDLNCALHARLHAKRLQYVCPYRGCVYSAMSDEVVKFHIGDSHGDGEYDYARDTLSDSLSAQWDELMMKCFPENESFFME